MYYASVPVAKYNKGLMGEFTHPTRFNRSLAGQDLT